MGSSAEKNDGENSVCTAVAHIAYPYAYAYHVCMRLCAGEGQREREREKSFIDNQERTEGR
jgi:hypothetical protein